MITGEIIEVKSGDSFGTIISHKIIEIITETIEEKGECFMAVSGGSTPLPVYEKLVSSKNQNTLDWSRVHLFFIDERCVPENDKENNFKSCFDSWLNNFPEIKHYRIEGWIEPKLAASIYENRVESIIKKADQPGKP